MDKDKIIELIKECKREAANPRNDGWVQQHYIERIVSIKKECEKALAELAPPKQLRPKVIKEILSEET